MFCTLPRVHSVGVSFLSGALEAAESFVILPRISFEVVEYDEVPQRVIFFGSQPGAQPLRHLTVGDHFSLPLTPLPLHKVCSIG